MPLTVRKRRFAAMARWYPPRSRFPVVACRQGRTTSADRTLRTPARDGRRRRDDRGGGRHPGRGRGAVLGYWLLLRRVFERLPATGGGGRPGVRAQALLRVAERAAAIPEDPGGGRGTAVPAAPRRRLRLVLRRPGRVTDDGFDRRVARRIGSRSGLGSRDLAGVQRVHRDDSATRAGSARRSRRST